MNTPTPRIVELTHILEQLENARTLIYDLPAGDENLTLMVMHDNTITYVNSLIENESNEQ